MGVLALFNRKLGANKELASAQSAADTWRQKATNAYEIIWELGIKIGKLEHQRNEARRKHGVLKRRFRNALARWQREYDIANNERAKVFTALVQANKERKALARELTDLRAKVANVEPPADAFHGITFKEG